MRGETVMPGMPQARKRSEETTIELSVQNLPDMRTASAVGKFRPTLVTITYKDEGETDVRVQGPRLVDGKPSPDWTSRYFLGDLGIDAGPAWIRRFLEDFRPNNRNGFATATLLSHEPLA